MLKNTAFAIFPIYGVVLVFVCDLAGGDKPIKAPVSSHKKLGSAGLALHYANIITQIDTLVSLRFSA